MKVTIFQSTKTNGKVPYSPFQDRAFLFETYNVKTINDVFFYLTSNFMLNLPLIKNTRNFRRAENLEALIVEKLEWVVVDIDAIENYSDRALCINYFKQNNYECILAESRNPLNIKGIMKVNNLTARETKQRLKEIHTEIPGVVDQTVCHRASYQAPILKSNVLYRGGSKALQKSNITSVTSAEQNIDTIDNIDIPNNIQNICKNMFIVKGFKFHEIKKGSFVCSHYSEKKSPKGFTWNPNNPFKMMHWNPDRVVDIWNDVIKTKEYKKYKKELAKQDIIKLMQPKTTKTTKTESNFSERFLGANTVTVEKFLNSYKILKVQSPMGTAKSNVIDEVINQSTERGLRVLLITNRISLADDISDKYNNIKHYQATDIEEGNYQIGDNLVCQVNSLYKFSLKYFDVVIIDEVTSLLFQLLNLEKNTKNIITKVFATKNKKVVLADAFIFDSLVDLFGNSIININNNYRDNAKLCVYTQVDKWMQTILEKTKEKGTITISSGSTKILKILEMLFETNNISYFTVSAETSQNEKQLVYKEFKKKNPRWKVIMYSPTITVGVSILASSNHHFHLDRGNSMDVVSSIQMIKRNRNAEWIHLILQERIKYNPTDPERIEKNLYEFTLEDDDGDNLGISDVGKKFSEVHRIYNILENRHKVSFLNLLRYQFDVNSITKVQEKVRPFVSKLGKLVQKKQTQEDLDLFLEYKKISPEELADIEYTLFNKTKREEKIKLFNTIIQDKTLKLSEENIDKLIEEEIKTGWKGIIDCYKNIIETPSIINSKNNYSYSIKEYKNYLALNIDLKEFGYKREKNIYRLNQVLIEILENK